MRMKSDSEPQLIGVSTSTLIGPALDWAVSVAMGVRGFSHLASSKHFYSPSTNWSHGGPLLVAEKISTGFEPNMAEPECAWKAIGSMYSGGFSRGRDPLVAGMRCLVAGKLGSIVRVPSELMP